MAVTFGLMPWGPAVGQQTEPRPQAPWPPVYPDRPGQGPGLPFVGEDGLGQRTLRLSQVADRLGLPGMAEEMPHHVRTSGGAGLVWHYPDRGLTLSVRPGEHRASDPRVAWMSVKLPFDGRTPQGLYLGMTEQQALPLIEAHYAVRGLIRRDGSGGHPARGSLTVSAANRGIWPTQEVSFSFFDGRLHEMGFQMRPTLFKHTHNDDKLGGALLAAALVAGVFWVVGVLRRLAGRRWRQLLMVLGGGLVAAGAAILIGLVHLILDRGNVILGVALFSMGVSSTVAGVLLIRRGLQAGAPERRRDRHRAR